MLLLWKLTSTGRRCACNYSEEEGCNYSEEMAKRHIEEVLPFKYKRQLIERMALQGTLGTNQSLSQKLRTTERPDGCYTFFPYW